MQRRDAVLATLSILDEGIKVSWISTHVFDLLLWVIFFSREKYAYVLNCHGHMFKSHHITSSITHHGAHPFYAEKII